jgi:hypothetical protein
MQTALAAAAAAPDSKTAQTHAISTTELLCVWLQYQGVTQNAVKDTTVHSMLER